MNLNDITKKLNARPSQIGNAPLEFDGYFADFFELYVLPNLPSKERVLEFDIRLEEYFRSPKPYHLVRAVKSLDRTKTYTTHDGHLVLASDNSPGWWLHAFLLSDLTLPSDMDEFLREIPRHIFKFKLKKNLNEAGFHLAHLANAKNGDTHWQAWDKEELERRTRVSIHPWNWSLMAENNSSKFGGDPNILGFIHHAYSVIYGIPYVEWRSRNPMPFSWDGAKIPYSYGHPNDFPKPVKTRDAPIKLAVTGAGKKLKGITIRAKWIGEGKFLSLYLAVGNYLVPHDDLLEWVGNNTNALKTKSWIEGLIYHWPQPSKKMAEFLESFRTG